MKNNPLSPTPPSPKEGRLHRLGSVTARRVRELFGHLSPQFDDVHRGVFFANNPVVAYTYAASRRGVGENDWGLTDVVDPPVLIGAFIPPDQEFYDTDAMVTAQELLVVGQMIQEEDAGERDNEEIYDYVKDMSRSEYYSFMYLGLQSLGGDIGNRANAKDVYKAAKKIAIMLVALDIPTHANITEFPDRVLEVALEEASKIVPQSRLIREVHEDEVIALIVMPPIAEPDEEQEFPQENPDDFLEESGELDADAIRKFDKYILDTGHVLYIKPGAAMRDINRWHGTTLNVAREAFPDIVTYARFHEGQQFGSAYDWDELEREREELDDEDEEFVAN
jgi:hypothetical protein